jgi:K(+)-stimulated pyrophosphate-energized sodium pump
MRSKSVIARSGHFAGPVVILGGLIAPSIAWAQDAVLTGDLAAPVAEATRLAAETAIPNIWWMAPISALLALVAAWFIFKRMIAAPEGNERMREIAAAVREGAFAYLRRQYKVVSIVFVVLLAIFTVLSFLGVQNPFVPVAFLTGGFFSGLCGFLGMNTATLASNRTAEGARHSLNRGLQVAFRSGAVMGLVVVGFGLLDISLWYFVLNYIYDHNVWGLSAKLLQNKLGMTWAPGMAADPAFLHAKLVEITTTMITFGMGASTQALFARVGGGIYTKAADVGADLVGKVEAGIPEDDPRNPATIADNVGDNVGDVAGMGADLYESYCGSILATSALGAALPLVGGMTSAQAVIAPQLIAAIGIILSIIGIFLVRAKEDATQKNLLRALLIGTLGSSILILVAVCFMAGGLHFMSWGMVGAVAAGLIAGVVIGQSTEYYTSDEYEPTKSIADQARMGPATTILYGISAGMLSTAVPVITICIGTLAAFAFAGGFNDISQGLYGVGFAAVGMLATLGITLATDAYGPIADNAGGNAEMSHLPAEVRKRTDALDALGNTTAATGKGFAIGSAALTALALIAAYIEEIRLWLGKMANTSEGGMYLVRSAHMAFVNGRQDKADQMAAQAPDGFRVIGTMSAKVSDFIQAYDVTLINPLVICGLLIGGMMAFVFCALTIKAVGRAAGAMVEEVRRQFKEKPGIMEGKD